MDKCPIVPKETIAQIAKELSISAPSVEAAARDILKDNDVELTASLIKKYFEDNTLKEGDEILVQSSKDKKIATVDTDIKRLIELSHMPSTNGPQQVVIGNLITGLQKYRDVLNKAEEENIDQVSVTSFKGSSIFKGDADVYNDFKHFGTFLHHIMEVVIRWKNDPLNAPKGIDFDTPITQWFTKEMFEELYYEYQKDITKAFDIENMTKDSMYKAASKMIEQLSALIGNGYVLVPEITLMGNTFDKDNSNLKLIGRADILAISRDGKVSVIDFKTKKVNYLTKQYKDPDTGEDTNIISFEGRAALLSLARTPYKAESLNGKTPTKFLEGKRTVFDEWFIQLELYSNMLRQMGIEVDVTQNNIVSLLYETDPDLKFKGQMVFNFNGYNYYNDTRLKYIGDAEAMKNLQSDPMINSDGGFERKKFNTFLKIINKAVPWADEVEEDTAKTIQDAYDLRPEDKDMESFNKTFVVKLDEQIKQLQLDLQKELQDEIRNLKKEQLKTLKQIKNNIDNEKESEDISLYRGIMFANTLAVVRDEITRLDTEFERLTKEYLFLLEQANNKEYSAEARDMYKRKSVKIYSQIWEIHNQNKILGESVDTLIQIANNVKDNPANKLSDESPIFKNVLLAYSQHETLRNKFVDVSTNMIVEILKGIGEESFKGVTTDLIQVWAAEQWKLTKKIQELQDKKILGFGKGLVRKIATRLNPSFNQVVGEEDEVAAEIKRLETRKDDINKLIQGLQYDDKSLTAIVKNMKDPSSILYIGARTLYNGDSIFDRMGANKFQASITDQDLGLASVMIMLKNAEGMMNDNMVNDKGLHNLSNKTDAILKEKGQSIEDLNKEVSSWRTVKYYNVNTGEITTSKQLFFTKPMSEEYENTYKDFQINSKIYKEDIKKKRSEYYRAIKDKKYNEAEVIKKEWDVLQSKSYKHTQEMMDWLVTYSNLPYIDSYYKLQAALPEKYKEQINDVYLEMYFISSEDLSMQTEDDADKLLILKAEIRRLKQEAKRENPKYAAIIEQMEGMYDPNINTARYESMKQNALRQNAQFPEVMDKWRATYEIRRPTQDWYQRRADLYEKRNAIFEAETNEELTELYQRKRDIMSRHKFNRVLNPRIISKEDIAELDGIESEIEEIRKNTVYKKLTNAQREALIPINQELAQMEKLVLSPLYKQELDKRTDLLIDKRNKYQALDETYRRSYESMSQDKQKELEEKLVEAKKDYDNYRDEYEIWYNERHKDTFVDPLVGAFNRNLAQPKSFNYEYTAVSEEDMEVIPNPDYFTEWKLNDNAKNPNYIEGVDNIPLPKGVISTGDGLYSLNETGMSNKYVDSQFKKITLDKNLKSYYDTLTSYYFKLQKQMVGQKMGYKVPGFASSKMENINKFGFKEGMSREAKIIFDKHFKFQSQQDVTENMFGDLGSPIRSRHSVQLSEELQTTDAIGAVYKFATEAHYNQSMQEVAPQIDGFISYVEEMASSIKKSRSNDPVIQAKMNQKAKEWDNMLDTMKYERRKFVQGQQDDPQDRKLKKGLNAMFQYISLMRLGFDVTNQMKNYTAGSVQFWIASGKDSKHYTDKDAITAYQKVYGVNGFLRHYFEDWGKITNVSDSTMLYRIMNPLQKDMIKYVSEITGGKSRRLTGKMTNLMELGYMVQDKGDTLIGLTTMYAVMNHYKYALIDPKTKQKVLDKDGKHILIPAHECYVKDTDGTLQIRPDVEYTKQDQLKLKRVIIAEMRRAQGNYASADQTRMEAKTLGKLMFFYRKYLVPLMLNRFGNLKPSWETGEAAYGYWRALIQAFGVFGTKKTLQQFFLGSFINVEGTHMTVKIENPNDNSFIETRIGDLYARKINQAARDTLAMIILSSLSMLALAMVKTKKDDDEPLSVIEGNAIRILWGTSMEAMAMFPLGGGSQEYIKNFTTALPMVSELTKSTKVVDHALKTMLVLMWNGGAEPDPDIDSEWYQEWYQDAYYQKKSGPYEAGTLKLKKDFIDLTGFDNIRDLFIPENRIEQLQGKQ